MAKPKRLRGYVQTKNYSWTKARAQKRADRAEKAGYDVKVEKMKTRVSRRTGYVLFARVSKGKLVRR